MPEYQSFGKLILICVLSVFTSCLVLIQALFRIVLSGGPSKYFSVKQRQRPSVLDNPDLGTHGYLKLKTLKIHYVSNGEEDRPLMLFLHGFPEFWYAWRHQLKEFGKDYRAVAIDMRGYGESDKPKGLGEYYIGKLTQDVKDVIEALGYEKAVVVGHDWGGAVAWHFCMSYPQMVERLIVCNIPHPRAMEKHLQTSLSQGLKSWYMLFFQMPCLPEMVVGSEDLRAMDQSFTAPPTGAKPGSFSLLDMEAYKYTFGQPGALTPPLNYYRAALRLLVPKPTVPKVTCPTLIIWGTNDTALEAKMAEMSRKYCQEELSIQYIEGASHWVQQEEPKAVNNFMRKFLAEKLG